MKKKWLAIIAFSLLSAACSDDNGADIASTAGIDETPSSSSIESTIESSSSDSPKSSAANFADVPSVGDRDYVILDSYDSYEGSGFGGGETSKGGVAVDVMGGAGGSNNRTSGLLTAGEWNDLNNWKFWSNLLNENKYYDKTSYWKFYPKNLVAVQVVDGNNIAVANVPVELLKGGTVLFSTKTDNAGFAYCWQSLFADDDSDIVASDYSLNVNGASYKEPLQFTLQGDEKVNFNVVVSDDAKPAAAKADIAFIVDATGSMTDEIRFLISDLNYIIDHASSGNKVALRTAALFYRDEKDDYLTRHDDFSDNVSTTQEFVSKQQAMGGGDYPEAVHCALEDALQELSWNESARARIAFLILDAPAHHKDDVIESLQKSISLFAQNGIKIIPVAASGVDKDTEFMLRFFELATGGTYVFLTNDSGIGNEHIEASVGDYEVEKLADLMVRLIKKYVE